MHNQNCFLSQTIYGAAEESEEANSTKVTEEPSVEVESYEVGDEAKKKDDDDVGVGEKLSVPGNEKTS